MILKIFDTKKLNLPRDVVRPDTLIINGEMIDATNQIVVIMQLGREIFSNAYVCNITDGERGKGIYDLPGFKFLKVLPCTKKEFEGVMFTMACAAEDRDWRPLTNWLW